MAARTGLADIITALRDLTDTTAATFSDDKLQLALDRRRLDLLRAPLEPRPTEGVGGTLIYQDYYARQGNLEATTGGTAIFVVADGAGNVAGTALWAADYARGLVSFAANTLGTAYYLTGRAYDLYGAASDVWRTKAGQGAKVYDISTDNHTLNRSQLMEHAMTMADYYAGMAWPQVTTLLTDDYCA